MPFQPYRRLPRPRNPKWLAVTGVSIYPLSLLYSQQSEMGFTPVYASYSFTSSQTLTAGTAFAVSFNVTDASGGGITLTTPSTIRIPTTGVYRIYSMVQVNRTSGGTGTVFSYLYNASTSSPISDSGMSVTVNQNVQTLLTDESILSLTAGTLIQFHTYSATSNNQLLAIAASSPVPTVPSVTLIVQRIA